jgi:hypothetical protein
MVCITWWHVHQQQVQGAPCRHAATQVH